MRAAAPAEPATVPRAVGAPAVSPLLTRLAAERATGAFLRAQGTLYLVDGRVVHAESPAAPGIDVLLTAGGALAAQGWQEVL
ncbi:transcriptional regulator, partial [Streptomyces sp. SID335]|nr:transcriptional regulator [Streptomyces sp. SID335]